MQSPKALTLRQNFSWTFMGNAVYAACQWGMLVVLAKLGDPNMVGQFTLGLAITAPVIMLTNLQLRLVQATDAKQQYLFQDYLGLRLISTTVALLIITAIPLLLGYRWETFAIVLLIGTAKALESVSDIFYGLLQRHEQMNRIAISLMMRGVLSLLLLGTGVYFTNSVFGGVVGLVVAWAVILIYYDIPSGTLILRQTPPTEISHCRSGLRPRWKFKVLQKLVWLTLPLGGVMMLISLNLNIPRYLIERQLGERELGIFAAIAYLSVAGSMIVSALAESASPRLANHYATGNSSAFRQLLFKLVGIGALLGGAAILIAHLAGEFILTVFYQPEYAQHVDLLVWIMVAAAIDFIASFLGYGMTAAGYFGVQIPQFIGVTGTSVIVCLYLIPVMGLMGAAIALMISTIVKAITSLGVIVYALHKIPRTTPNEASSRVG